MWRSNKSFIIEESLIKVLNLGYILSLNLPIGIQTFDKIRENDFVYVDKTELIYKLASSLKPSFLSRPRRFGKSLLVSTLDALFSAKRELFRGLWIEKSDWDWIEYPIINLDMSPVFNRTPEGLEQNLIRELNAIAKRYGISLNGESAANYLQDLIIKMGAKQKVVVLIDEYDKPLIDHIDNNIEIAKANQKILREFYTILKSQDKHLRFVFLTGVTKFSKVSVFSGINNLNDWTMSNAYSTLLGYTKAELEKYFAKDIEALAQKKQISIPECYNKIKEWYNGYKFSSEGELVYNPLSTMQLLENQQFSGYWFETGTPTFLVNLLKKREFDIYNLEDIEVDAESFGSFDIEDLPTLPLLYQTGYLTIQSYDEDFNSYKLGFPNREVREAFSKNLLSSFASSRMECSKLLVLLSRNLRENPWDFALFFELCENIFALIPYDLYLKHEKYFHSLFYLAVKLAGFRIGAEIHTQHGRTDAALEDNHKVIIFEFKFNETAQAAIDQIKHKKYYQLYQVSNRPIYLVGINFNGERRIIDGWLVERL